MKKLLYIMLVCFAIAACDFEPSNNGDLDGNWQLHKLDTLATGGRTDMRQSGIYWCVQGRLLEIRGLNVLGPNVLFRFKKEPATLTIYNPVCDNRDVSDSLVTSIETLKPYGVLHLEEVFQIETFNSDDMVLVNDLYRFHLRKY